VVHITSTRLFNLNPIGEDTAYVECLTSYIGRLAKAHSVTVGTLVARELAPVLNKVYILKSCNKGGSRFYESAKEINGIGKTAEDCIAALQRLTGRTDLRNLTLVTLGKILSSRGLLRSHLAWCPACFEEWRIKGEPIYQPLIWNFQVVNYCWKHNINLNTRCPSLNCGKENPLLNRRFQPGYCTYCGIWLGSTFSQKIAGEKMDEITKDRQSFNRINIEQLITLQQ
jgi:hypothetical protein